MSPHICRRRILSLWWDKEPARVGIPCLMWLWSIFNFLSPNRSIGFVFSTVRSLTFAHSAAKVAKLLSWRWSPPIDPFSRPSDAERSQDAWNRWAHCPKGLRKEEESARRSVLTAESAGKVKAIRKSGFITRIASPLVDTSWGKGRFSLMVFDLLVIKMPITGIFDKNILTDRSFSANLMIKAYSSAVNQRG